MADRLRVTELDFDQIKNNLKTFLNQQTEFTDYDFEGSGLSTLLDVLAYNTHYNAYLANMVVNEMFLDSAVKRSSAVSIAKHLGYTPVSSRGSVANLDIVVTSPSNLPAALTMDRYTPFTSTVDGVSYTFLTTEAKTASRVGTTYTFADTDVTEGTLLSFSYVVTDVTPAAKYEIPSESVDTTTIKVSVQTSSSDTTTATTFDISALTNTKVYTVYMPFSAGTGKVKFSWTGGTGLAAANQVAGSVEVNLTDTNAANAAAIAALQTSVASLRTLLVTLTNLVLKIQKKVKA